MDLRDQIHKAKVNYAKTSLELLERSGKVRKGLKELIDSLSDPQKEGKEDLRGKALNLLRELSSIIYGAKLNRDRLKEEIEYYSASLIKELYDRQAKMNIDLFTNFLLKNKKEKVILSSDFDILQLKQQYDTFDALYTATLKRHEMVMRILEKVLTRS